VEILREEFTLCCAIRAAKCPEFKKMGKEEFEEMQLTDIEIVNILEAAPSCYHCVNFNGLIRSCMVNWEGKKKK